MIDENTDIKGHNKRFRYILKNAPNQSDKFIEAAREHGCDESEEAFNEKLKKLAETKPADEKETAKD